MYTEESLHPWDKFHLIMVYMHACLVTQLWLTLCNIMDWSPPGSSVYGILQARILEWVAMLSSRGLSCPGMEPTSLTFPALASVFFFFPPVVLRGKPLIMMHNPFNVLSNWFARILRIFASMVIKMLDFNFLFL